MPCRAKNSLCPAVAALYPINVRVKRVSMKIAIGEKFPAAAGDRVRTTCVSGWPSFQPAPKPASAGTKGHPLTQVVLTGKVGRPSKQASDHKSQPGLGCEWRL